jgi:FKBP-type peptidyl-prolyl cis-trans isomerase (trigger factor)
MKAQFTKDTDEMYKIEFVLAKIAEEEKLLVDQTELDAVLATAKTEKEKEVAKANLAWYETLLRKQKVIDFLNSL